MALITTARTLISVGVHHTLKVIHCDVPQAFIQSPLNRDIWLQFPPGLSIKSEVLDRIKAENPNAKALDSGKVPSNFNKSSPNSSPILASSNRNPIRASSNSKTKPVNGS